MGMRLRMFDRLDQGEFKSSFLAHEKDIPKGDTFLGH